MGGTFAMGEAMSEAVNDAVGETVGETAGEVSEAVEACSDGVLKPTKRCLGAAEVPEAKRLAVAVPIVGPE